MATNNSNINALTVPDTHALDNISTQDLTMFRRESLLREPSKYTKRAQINGHTDTVGHIGIQLSTNDVVGKVLTINSLCRAEVPTLDRNGNPVPAMFDDGTTKVDENGEIVYETSIFPIVTFAEAPGYWYNGGTMLSNVINDWIMESGDEPDSFTFPKLNADLEAIGGIPVYFQWKQGKNNTYVNMILA